MSRAWFLALALLTSGCEDAVNAMLRKGVDDILAGDHTLHAVAPADLPAFFDCLRESSYALAAAHRGGPAPGFAENSIETFAHTLSQAPVFLEVDVARTRDGALVLMHDETVDRTTNGEGPLADLTLADLQALSLKDDNGEVLSAHPPTLRQALDWANGVTVLELDIKRDVAYEDVVREVRDAGAAGRVILITYSIHGARRIHELAPEIMLSASIAGDEDLDAMRAVGFDFSRLLAWTGTREPDSELNVALAQEGIEVVFGTLGGAESWDRRFARSSADQYAAFAEAGVQLFATDRPIEAARDLDAGDGAAGYGALNCTH